MSDAGGITEGVVESGKGKPDFNLLGIGTPDVEEVNQAILDQFGLKPEGDDDDTKIDDDDTPPSDDSLSDDDSIPPVVEDEEDEPGGEDQGTGATGELDFATRFEQTYGKPPTQEDVDAFFNLAQWVGSLTNEQRDTINSYLAQGYTPKQILDANDPQTSVAQSSPTPTDERLAKLKSLAEEYKDDEQLGPLYAEMVDQREALITRAQADAQAQQQQIISQIAAASEEFQTQHSLTDGDIQKLHNIVAQSRVMPGLMQSFGDAKRAMAEALEFAFYRDPEFRTKIINAEVESRATKAENHGQRKRRAASVTGTGGNAASRTAPPPKTADDRWAAVRTELAEAQQNGN